MHTPQEITKPILEAFQRHLFYYRKANGQPLAFNSQHVFLSAIKCFFKWLTQQNHLLYNPASELHLPKRPKRLPRAILSIDEIEKLLKQPAISTPEGLRDRAVMELLYSTGTRGGLNAAV